MQALTALIALIAAWGFLFAMLCQFVPKKAAARGATLFTVWCSMFVGAMLGLIWIIR